MHACEGGDETAKYGARLSLHLLEKERVSLVGHGGAGANELVRKASQPSFANPEEQCLGDAT